MFDGELLEWAVGLEEVVSYKGGGHKDRNVDQSDALNRAKCFRANLRIILDAGEAGESDLLSVGYERALTS